MKRVKGNDLPNAEFILENTDLSKHKVLELEDHNENPSNMVNEFIKVLEFVNIKEGNNINITTQKRMLETIQTSLRHLDRKITESQTAGI